MEILVQKAIPRDFRVKKASRNRLQLPDGCGRKPNGEEVLYRESRIAQFGSLP